MFTLKKGYLFTGIITGLILLFSFIWSLPDGKLHVVFCSVGQGDGAYIRFPDGRDMVVDGGPNDSMIGCLSRHMPFWDRRITMVLNTHPQKDHLQGLIAVLDRFTVDYVLRSDIDHSTEGYQQFMDIITRKKIPIHYQTAGQKIIVGTAAITFIWPSDDQIAKGKDSTRQNFVYGSSNQSVLGSSTIGDINDYSLVFWLTHGSFDALFTGDADSRVEGNYTDSTLPDGQTEVLKVPHHGSKTGMTERFVQWLKPKVAVISVGKNTYGHPSTEAINLLQSVGSTILRTDQEKDVEIISDGKTWQVAPH